MIRRLLIVALAIAALAAAPFVYAPQHQAKAATAQMCQGDVSGASTGSRTIGGVGSQVPSQTVYILNSAGCALISQADIGYFQSIGFTFLSGLQPIIFTTGVASGTTNFVIGLLPANAYISQVVAVNATANAVTGNISIGSTANGTDVVASLACGANCVSTAPGTTTIAKPAFSTTTATSLNMAAITAWNNANVTITVTFGNF